MRARLDRKGRTYPPDGAPILAIQFWPALDHHEIRGPAFFEFETGFLPPETGAPKGALKDDVSAQIGGKISEVAHLLLQHLDAIGRPAN
jgi:hypothetical protein